MDSTKRLSKSVEYSLERFMEAFRLPFIVKERRVFAATLFGLLLLAHLIVLPADVLGTAIGWRSFQYISPEIAIFALLFASLETVLINLWIHLIREKSKCKKASATCGIFIGVVSPLLCCTPLLPTILSIIAIVFPTAVLGLGIRVQYFVNTYQSELLILALVLLLLAIMQNSLRLNANLTMKKHSR